MAVKQYTIYSAVPPYEAKTVSASERKKYLNCKFWKSSKKEAEIFFYLYFLPPCYWGMEVVVAILSGAIFKANSTDHLLKNINEIYVIYKQDLENEHLLNNKKYTELIQAIEADSSYRNFSVIDDAVYWASSKKIINANTEKLIRLELAKTRVNVFKENVTSDFLNEQIHLLINSGHTYIFYNDVQKLLFPEHDLFADLKEEAESSDRVMANASLNRKHIYFDIKILLKWLMQKGYLSEQLTEAFRPIKVESIKENIVPYMGGYNSLQKLIQQGADRDDLLYEVLQGRPLYWKYPIDCKCRKDIDNYCVCNHGVLWRATKSSVKHEVTATQRLDGFGQLKQNVSDDTFDCRFGGLTVDMLRHNKLPQKTSGTYYEVEIVSTKEEVVYDVQPFIKISHDELIAAIADDRLGFLEDITLHQVNDPDNAKNPSETKKDKKKSPTRLQLLIQKKLIESEDKTPETIWRIIRKERDLCLWIDLIEPWSDGRSATIKWGTRKTTNKTLSRAAFETYVSKLNRGKQVFAKEDYDEVYENEDN
ncbi:hypothetical protein TUM19329_01740 [Legionella antarctica]|uniref:Uncharacterized protein n=1 Tax=Legionella antarctica TaxID=2708020 RepID=A0A6F8T0R4_9GAMM|nr:hypothetical protein [Legionella antarctica]BCA93813.1 hypothetical protein TUM19329_01740 [Legionella antarctica]